MFSNFLNGEEINGLFFADCPFCGGQMVCNEREFVCYDCGEHGDIADFLAKKNRVSKTTARWQLNHESNKDLFYVLEKACEYYSSRLNFENAYLVKRGITEETAKVYRLGWADGNLIKFLENEGIELLTAQRAGLIKPKGNTYRDIFYKYYAGNEKWIKGFWMPNREWPGCNVNDPSARVLSNYGDSGK